jgi:hypothetical protein
MMGKPARPRNFGTVPAGWRREAWIDCLRHRAKACRTADPDKAAMYDDWADVLTDPEEE